MFIAEFRFSSLSSAMIATSEREGGGLTMQLVYVRISAAAPADGMAFWLCFPLLRCNSGGAVKSWRSSEEGAPKCAVLAQR